MAIQRQITCNACRQTKKIWCRPNEWPSTCNDCAKDQALAKKDNFLVMRASLTIEERLALLESEQYDHSLVEHGYIEAPRF